MRWLAAVAVLAWPAGSRAGPWTRELWSFYAKAGADFYSASGFVDPRTGRETGQSYFGRQYGVYAEVGVLRAWPVQVSASIPVTSGTATFFDEESFGDREARATTTRLGDGRFALQTSILREGLQLAAALEAKVPLYRNGEVADDPKYEQYRIYFPLPGDGQLDFTGWVLAGTSIPDAPMWAEAAVGYRHRTELFVGWDPEADLADGPRDLELVDGLAFRGLFGLQLGPVLLMANAEGIRNLRSDRYTRQSLSVGPSLLLTVWRGLALEARLAAEVWADNQSRGMGFGTGVSYRDPV